MDNAIVVCRYMCVWCVCVYIYIYFPPQWSIIQPSKRIKILSFVTAYMDPKGIMLSETSQRQILYMIVESKYVEYICRI